MSELVSQGSAQLDPMILRESILEVERRAMALPADQRFHEIPVKHHFTDGIYTRTCFMRAGDLIIGKIHKLEHIVVISQGRAKVVSEEFGHITLTAPVVFVSPPEVKRTLLIEEDMVWTTVHPNPSNTQDLQELEDQLIMKNYEGDQT